jgi:hypothetical protein
MAACPNCGRAAAETDAVCPACGTALAADPLATAALGSSDTDSTRKSSSRFALGELLAGRYRVVAPIGKGGMGEVYRADDLTLGQPVALKFLPAQLDANPEQLARFRREVAAARRVSHPNVCRVYDIGEHEGQPFLAMEYIDGEDLSSLLRRVGRLPEEKGLQFARELCSALAAVHEQGLLHRDLKPANVMLDGRGKVRLTDFGLAVRTAEKDDSEPRAGTPMYMAPEQLNGQGVSERSDLFSLGLVLYELFTGRKAFPAQTRDDLVKRFAAGGPEKPSSHAGQIHPSVERAILRCLAANPAERPASAAEVLATLPGGDPLAAAMAAGETPSPHLVAAAGGAGRLNRRTAGVLLAAAIVVFLLAGWLNDYASLFRQVPQESSPRELAARSRTLCRQFGYTEHPADRATGVVTDETLAEYLREHDSTPSRWTGIDRGWPAVEYFWYRQGPSQLTQRLTPNDATGWSMPGRVTPGEPAFREPGETCVFLDLSGRLIEFHAIPPRTASDEPASRPHWNRLLEAAGLDKASLRAVPPKRVPPTFADEMAAWETEHPDRPGLTVRVEAATYRGRPVYFFVGPEEALDRLTFDAGPGNAADVLQDIFYGLLGLTTLTVGAWLAVRNRRLGRADRAGALSIAGAFVIASVAGWLLTAKHVISYGDESAMFAGMAGRALWDGFALWLAYLALEPVVRRKTPWRMIGWNRLLEGRWRDPRVGRDVLVGLVVGSAGEMLALVIRLASRGCGWPMEHRQVWDAALTEGAGILFLIAAFDILVSVRDFFLFVLLTLAVRREWIAAILAVALLALPGVVDAEVPWVKALSAVAFYSLAFFLLLRFGFLAYMICNFAGGVWTNMPIALDSSAWYAATSFISLLVLAGLATYGYLVATRGREQPAGC